ncbi:MAG: phosphopentomutase [Paracoccaceae bacterium]|jgi:phosphopentomutase|nr:MAG: phosphopentomutase [Paracoccaceae bacterium]RPF93872.1 MAG: phosphopentomutase [Rhodobacteraceae bacterium TMED160]|tara:strand:- start:476 stop:1654 length:1179 start_codon:yes stop_codon:yes gene_type:complete
MARVFLVVMDSVGIGGAPDADKYFNGDISDFGSNTVLHIAEYMRKRGRPLKLPQLNALGLGSAIHHSAGIRHPDLPIEPDANWAVGQESSRGKDTPSGHWEIAGLPVTWDWHYFKDKTNSFPTEIINLICQIAQVDGILGNKHASGIRIIEEFGQSHVETSMPICYTSADSVFQIAAHETVFGLDRLYDLCEKLSPAIHNLNVGRVIARPFGGSKEEGWERTKNRRDYAMLPPSSVLTDWVKASGGKTYAIGKIGDIFSMRNIDSNVTGTDRDLMRQLQKHIEFAEDGSLIFANFVEFDSLFGHRRDPIGYAKALEWFDTGIADVVRNLLEDDLLIVTADHGNDPTWSGTDHTREQVPVLLLGKTDFIQSGIELSDVATLASKHLGVAIPDP